MQYDRLHSSAPSPPPLTPCRHLDRLGSRARAVLVRQDIPDDAECPADGYTLSATDDAPVSTLVATRGGAGFAAAIPGEYVAGSVVTQGISSTLSLYQTALIVRLILTWFPSPPQALAGPLSTICRPRTSISSAASSRPSEASTSRRSSAFVALDLLTGSASSLGAEAPEGAAVYGTAGRRKAGAAQQVRERPAAAGPEGAESGRGRGAVGREQVRGLCCERFSQPRNFAGGGGSLGSALCERSELG